MVVQLKNGNLELREAEVPQEVRPGQAMAATVVVKNGAGVIWAGDKDRCDSRANPCEVEFGDTLPYCLNVVMDPDWRTPLETGPTCVNGSPIGTNSKQFRFSFQAPMSAGEHTLAFFMSLPGSGAQSNTLSARFLVSEDAPQEPPDGGNGNDEGFDVATWIAKNPVQAGIVGIGSAFVIDRTIDAVFEE